MAELNQDVEYDDLLLSALITISPRRIILHVISPIEIVETIVNVFRERVRICEGCDLCRSLRKPKVLSNPVKVE